MRFRARDSNIGKAHLFTHLDVIGAILTKGFNYLGCFTVLFYAVQRKMWEFMCISAQLKWHMLFILNPVI